VARARQEGLRIALICPHAWPPRDDLSSHVEAEAQALARRGHAVTVLAPTTNKESYASGRERLRRTDSDDNKAIVAQPGEVLLVSIARALPARRGRRLVGPFDVSSALETAIAKAPFDVTHLHEPLSPSPALAALRRARGLRAVTFHRPETAAGAAFLRPLVRRVLARVDLRVAVAESTRRAVEEVLPGDYSLIRPGADLDAYAHARPAGSEPVQIAVVARSRDRTGIRYALAALRTMDRTGIDGVTVIASPTAPWRARQTIPRSLRDIVDVIPDDDDQRAEVLARSQIVVFPSPEELIGPVAGEALARGAAVLVPRAPELEGLLVHGRDALALPPFERESLQRSLEDLVANPARRSELGAEARRNARSWDDAAAELEARYLADTPTSAARASDREQRIPLDLRIRPAAGDDPGPWIEACRNAGVRAVAVAAAGSREVALRIADAAPAELGVILGQEVRTREGAVVGLFLEEDVPSGLGLEESIDAIHEQGAVVVAPHPDAAEAPAESALRRVAAAIDCWETLVPDEVVHGTRGSDLARRFGALVLASSAARTPAQVGRVWTEMRPFTGPADFLDALADATLHTSPAGRPRRRRKTGRSA
jgi:phosphatidylinositol alpha-mannosyltransferase